MPIRTSDPSRPTWCTCRADAVITTELQLRAQVVDAICAHARNALPNEVVGLLAGSPSGEVVKSLPLSNIAEVNRFLADPYEQYKAIQAITELGLSLLAIYHSHPGGPARLSASDRRYACRHDALHVIIAIEAQIPDVEIRAYRVTQDRCDEVDVHYLS